MHQYVFISILLAAAILLGAFDHALMIFQIRERMGFNPTVSMLIGSTAGLLTHILIAVSVVWIFRNK